MFCPNPECSHFEQTALPAEFPAGTSHCAHCGAELVGGAPPADPAATLEDVDPGDDDLVPLTRIDDPAFATSFRSLLESEGIRHAMRGEAARDSFGSGRGAAGVEMLVEPPMLLVDATRVEEARELLAAATSSPEMPKRDDLSE